MIPVDMRTSDDCLRACLCSIFEIPYEDGPDTEPPEDPMWSQNNVINDWLRDRGFIAFELHAEPTVNPVLRRTMHINPDQTKSLGDALWPWPAGVVHYLGSGQSPRNPDSYHSVVMNKGKIVHDPHPARDMKIGAIDTILLVLRRDPEQLEIA